MMFPAYPDYRDSGVEWLEVVPKHWGVKPLRYLGRFRKGLTITKADLTDTGIPCLNYGEVHSLYPFEVNQDIQALKCVPAEYLETEPSSCVGYGDFVFADTSEDLEGVGNFTHVSASEPLFAGYHTIIYSLDSDVSSRFLAYCLESFAFRTQLRIRVKGVKVFSVTQEILRGGIACIPTTVEQTQIARFLDHETACIDALIEEQQRLIELLKEKRQAVISHAVTKGLDPTVPMKDSGVEWLGEVPAHWDVARVKNIAKLESGHTPSKEFPEYWDGGDIPWVSLNDSKQLKVVDYIDETQYMITALGMNNSSARLLPARAVVFTRDATIGLAAITTREMCVSQHLIAWICNENFMLPEYLLLVFYAMEEELGRFTFGATLKTIGMPDVRKLTTTVPPLTEQAEVVAEVSSKRGLISRLISEGENGIALLQERRSALISAAVTGKIDVRSWRPPASAPIPELAQEAV
ncbi:restriction endonuclease subunit S [Pseudomonas sp. sia0905]|uniref:restriction endonuclease subunit S n=1 Tax=Pseudomonas sp. sia0905 TaxID=2854783 RepID=UPI001C443B0C|nr:restriction endonuclease subunit S [Pseudomonas sp. sia0905]MBV7564791.1 restriction endonuclease subunit S [Pseudomonas sp. sia0905]